eukprot:4070723-Pyramimonas_sp.AAC.1
MAHFSSSQHSTAPGTAHQHRYFEHSSCLSPKFVVTNTSPCLHFYIPFRVRGSIMLHIQATQGVSNMIVLSKDHVL